ncbi:MAG TPA: ubiquitin-like protein Pup [Acidimicrobiia bacterium]|nr:ubiquitin-like protein Pup [Acidimicrobiia bacterium]
MKQERVIPARPKKTAEAPEVEEIVVDELDAGLLNDIDELLDEIDAVLEEQSVLVNYRQRSGQ